MASVHNAAFVLGFFTLASQFVALFRDRLLAHIFGASGALDIYYSAFKIPDILFILVASLVSVSVIVPFIVSGDEKENKKFLDSVFSFFSILMIVVSVIAFFLMPWFSQKLFPGFSLDEIHSMVNLSRIMLLSPILLGISNIYGAITQAKSKFFFYALAPLFYNIGIVIGIIILVPKFGLLGLALGVVLGAVLHLSIQLPAVLFSGIAPRITLSINFKQIVSVLKLSIPRTFTLATNQIVLLVFFSIASLMAVGSIAVFNFSLNLQSVPLGVIGVSYSLAAFPTLARFYRENNMEKYISHIVIALRHIIFWSIPVVVYFVVLRAQIIRVVLGSGQFSWEDTRLTAATLALFSVSVISQGIILLFVRAFYATGRTKIPFVIASISVVTSIAFAIIGYEMFLNFPVFADFITSMLRISDINGSEIVTLAFAYSAGNFLNLILLWVFFEKEIGKIFMYVKKTLIHSVTGAVIGGTVSYLMLSVIAPYLQRNTLIGIFSQGLIAGIVGIMVNITVLHIFGNSELKEIVLTLKGKIWRAKPVVTDSEVV